MSLEDLKAKFFREVPKYVRMCSICGVTSDEVPVYDVKRFVVTLNTRLCKNCERKLKESVKASLEMVIRDTPQIITSDRDFHTVIGLLEAELPFCISLLRKWVLLCDLREVRKLTKRIKEYLNRIIEYVDKCERRFHGAEEVSKP